jgi:hypothetical protein
VVEVWFFAVARWWVLWCRKTRQLFQLYFWVGADEFVFGIGARKYVAGLILVDGFGELLGYSRSILGDDCDA